MFGVIITINNVNPVSLYFARAVEPKTDALSSN